MRTAIAVKDPARPAAGTLTQRLRLWTGLILFAFVLSHYLNHALGLISLDVMEAVGAVRRAIWRSAPGTLLLYGALLVHAALALSKVAGRRTWRIPALDALQLGLGLVIPFLLVDHIVGTRGLAEVFGLETKYPSVVDIMFPGVAVPQTVLLFVVWAHAVIGLHLWLRLKAFYARAFPLLLTFAVVVPIMATLGWLSAGRRMALEGERASNLTSEAVAWAGPVIAQAEAAMLAAIAVAFALATANVLGVFGRKGAAITYPGETVVLARPGTTLLEVSRENGIPHTAVCGGRARCSTCRTRILEGAASLPPPSVAEKAVLERVGAEPDVRLACQIRPRAPLTVRPLLPAKGASGDRRESYRWGVEQEIAVMFVDIRGFTALSERRLAFDVVFILNTYADLVESAVRDAGGVVDKFIGDGVMALFGIASGPQSGARQALQAAATILKGLDALNDRLEQQLAERLAIGIGIHTGPAILGRIGSAGQAAGLTALGDTVNIASRLESASKELAAPLIISNETLDAAQISPAGLKLPAAQLPVRGRKQSVKVYPVPAEDGVRLFSRLSAGEAAVAKAVFAQAGSR